MEGVDDEQNLYAGISIVIIPIAIIYLSSPGWVPVMLLWLGFSPIIAISSFVILLLLIILISIDDEFWNGNRWWSRRNLMPPKQKGN